MHQPSSANKRRVLGHLVNLLVICRVTVSQAHLALVHPSPKATNQPMHLSSDAHPCSSLPLPPSQCISHVSLSKHPPDPPLYFDDQHGALLLVSPNKHMSLSSHLPRVFAKPVPPQKHRLPHATPSLTVQAVASHLYVAVDAKLPFFVLVHMHHLPDTDYVHGSPHASPAPSCIICKSLATAQR